MKMEVDMNIKYSLEKISNRIYHCIIKDRYDLAMTFCRVQEFYESPFKEIRGKSFDLLNLMRMYAKRSGEGYFGYPADWAGFNIPGSIIQKCYYENSLTDWNMYDEVILDIHESITSELDERHPNYYLIGSEGNNETTKRHEIAHALFHLNKDYKNKATKIIKTITPRIYKQIEEFLLEIGYSKKVIVDEINAYFSTEDSSIWESLKPTKKEKKILTNVQSNLTALLYEYELMK
ncbi:hypothetical protein EBU95_00440 [bacterium]|nr:hypothetical protein [bacterium]